MAIGKISKISKIERSRYYKKYLKKMMSKQRRLQERRDVENAPQKNMYYGWSV